MRYERNVNKAQSQSLEVCFMDSYTLFGHIVGIVGTNQCMQAHIELSGLGVLPEMTLEKTNALNQNDAEG